MSEQLRTLPHSAEAERGIIGSILLDTTMGDDARVLEIYPDALACDMESAAIAQVCHHYGVPFLSFRMISDVHGSGQDATALYKDFWTKVADDSFAFLKLLIDKL